MLLSMQCSFPKLSPRNITQYPKEFEGFISVNNKDYYIYIETPNFPEVKNIILKPEIELIEIISNSDFNTLKIEESCTVLEYLKLLQETCERYVCENSALQALNVDDDHHSQFSLLLSHIEDLGWEKIAHIASDFSSVDLEYRDEKERRHTIHVKITSKYSIQTPSVEVDLPLEVKFNNAHRTLSSIYENWKSYIVSLQPFWNVLDDLDAVALVIDPSNPLRKHTTRRICLENQVSIHLTVSPDRPFAPPKFQLLGPSFLVTPLNDKLLQLYQAWDESETIVDNVEHLLRERVVKRNSSDRNEEEENAILDELNVECAVCYSLHLENQLPDYTCDNCRKSFHLQCLYDWIRSLPSSRQSRQYIRGDCPFCMKPISCKVPT